MSAQHHRTPVFVVSFNRGGMLRRVVRSYRALARPVDVVIHDNGSTDPFTLAVLAQFEREGTLVVRRKRITHPDQLDDVDETVRAYFGGRAPSRYVVTDCDIDMSTAPAAALDVFDELLDRHPDVLCVGPMLRIEDIPPTYPLRNAVLNRHIEALWRHRPEIVETSAGPVAVLRCLIDTTFALHRAGEPFRRLKRALRVYAPYEALHLDWYLTAPTAAYGCTSANDISHWDNAEGYRASRGAPLAHDRYYVVRPAADGSPRVEEISTSGEPAGEHAGARAGRISVVLATPPHFNPGMTATELALLAFLDRHGWLQQARFYRSMSTAERLAHLPLEHPSVIERRGPTGIAYRSLLDEYDSAVDADVVLFWADFLHMGQFVRGMHTVFAKHLAERGDAREPAAVLRDLYLLAGAEPDALARTLSFGTTLLFNTFRDWADASYAESLRRFLRSAKRVWVRDAMSAAQVAQLRRDYDRGYFGVDCALLLNRADVLGGARFDTGSQGAGEILTFFGRGEEQRAALTQAAGGLGAALGRPLRELPWFGAEGPPVRAMLQTVARASLVVTDTYHLAVVAWNFGVPAVCAFGGHTSAPVDVSSGTIYNWRDKREVFYSQYDALDYLIRPEELIDPARLQRRVQHVIESLRNPERVAAVTAAIRAHAQSAERALAGEIQELLARRAAGVGSPA